MSCTEMTLSIWTWRTSLIRIKKCDKIQPCTITVQHLTCINVDTSSTRSWLPWNFKRWYKNMILGVIILMAKTTLGYGNFKSANFPQYHTKSVYSGLTPPPQINISQYDCLLCTEAFIGLNLKSNAGPSTIKNSQISDIFEWLGLNTPLLIRIQLTKLTRMRSAPTDDGSLVSSRTVYSAITTFRRTVSIWTNSITLNTGADPPEVEQKQTTMRTKPKHDIIWTNTAAKTSTHLLYYFFMDV
jgi:hypothetical protein